MKRLLLVTALMAILLFIVSTTNAEDYDLSGIIGVEVTVFVDDNLATEISENRLKTTIELTLRRSGVRVFSDKSYEELFAIIGDSAYHINSLYLNVQGLPIKYQGGDRTGEFIYVCRLSILEYVQPSRLFWVPALTAYTWMELKYGNCDEKELSELINKVSTILAEEFANDFLKANEKSTTAEITSIYKAEGKEMVNKLIQQYLQMDSLLKVIDPVTSDK